MKNLREAVISLVDQPDRYRWSVPADSPVPFCCTGNDHADSQSMRATLAAEFERNPALRFAIATWVVRRWGGIRRIGSARIDEYLSTLCAGSFPALLGISSWSKIAMIRDPERFCIYDARVAFTLNILCKTIGLNDLGLFPVPLGRNSLIEPAARLLRLVRVSRSMTASPYLAYLKLVKSTGKPIQEVEMALFAAAPRLAEDVLATRAAWKSSQTIFTPPLSALAANAA